MSSASASLQRSPCHKLAKEIDVRLTFLIQKISYRTPTSYDSRLFCCSFAFWTIFGRSQVYSLGTQIRSHSKLRGSLAILGFPWFSLVVLCSACIFLWFSLVFEPLATFWSDLMAGLLLYRFHAWNPLRLMIGATNLKIED